MKSLLPARMKDLDDLKETDLRRSHCGSLDLRRMAFTVPPFVARIELNGPENKERRRVSKVNWGYWENGLGAF